MRDKLKTKDEKQKYYYCQFCESKNSYHISFDKPHAIVPCDSCEKKHTIYKRRYIIKKE